MIQYSIELHHKNEKLDQFGILKLNMPILKKNEWEKKIHILFSIDNSCSMNLKGKDGKTKLEYLQDTLQNMMNMFLETKKEVSIHIITFNHSIDICIPNSIITTNNIKEIINNIQNIKPNGSTNIELALKYASNHINLFKNLFPDYDVTHILLTDGNPNKGSTNVEYLKSLVNCSITNIFIGYGMDHDVYLLNEIANSNNNYYLFIDKLDHAYFIYGEIIHNIIYKFAKDICIQIENGVIYDYKNNTWQSNIYIGNLVYGAEKIYQIKIPINAFHFSISLVTLREENRNIKLINTTIPIEKDLTPFIFRQETQELLFKVKQHHIHLYQNKFKYNEKEEYIEKDILFINKLLKNNKKEIDNQEELLKVELEEFLNKLLFYMEEKGLKQNKFMNMLYNDIDISCKLLGKKKACLYACSRHTSQGEQTSYSLHLQDELDMEIDNKNFYSPYMLESMLETWGFLKKENNNDNENEK